MKCVMVMFDSLNRHMLPPYNPSTEAIAPNFKRLAEKTMTFDRSYVCSMPCMPARRDLHTGRPNFLHNHWGPLEPFDDSFVERLNQAGVYTHMDTDHYHYFEDGGATYHTRYQSWQCFRGQEGDPFFGQVKDPDVPKNINGKGRRADWVNRPHITAEPDMPQTKTFDAGLSFINRNAAEDNWFLQIECFDPHEPWTIDPKYRDQYPALEQDEDVLGIFDWPPYAEVTESEEAIKLARRNYLALLTKCDHSLGLILDAMDENNLWEDTMLVVWTDHGFMLGEHGCWAKNWMPLYEEVSHTPFFLHDPRMPENAGERRNALIQPSIDLAPTLLDFFNVEAGPNILGNNLKPVIEADRDVRDYAIFGYHYHRINITDGRYTYYRDPVTTTNGPQYRYTLMPYGMRNPLPHIDQAELQPPFSFTQNMPTLKIPVQPDPGQVKDNPDHLLFDLATDPNQITPLNDPDIEQKLIQAMTDLVTQCDAPTETYQRLGLPN